MANRHARHRVPVRVRVSRLARRPSVWGGLLALALVPVLLGVHVVFAAFTSSTSNTGNNWQASTVAAASGLTSSRVGPTGGMVQLSWTASPTSFVSSYTIERSTVSTGPFTTIASMAVGTSGVTEFSSGMSASGAPQGVTAGPDGNVWFTERDANRVGRMTPSGTATTFAIPTAGSQPASITAGPDGNLWFTESLVNRVARVTPAGVITEYVLPDLNSGPAHITVGPDGALWVTLSYVSRIARVTTAGVITTFALPTSSANPRGIAAGPDGNLWVAETDAGKLARVTTSGAITEYPVPTASSGPYGIVPGPGGTMWFTERDANKIGKFSVYFDGSAPSVTEYSTGLPAASQPLGLTPGTDGNMYVALSAANAIAKVTSSGTITSTGLPSSASLPQQIVVGPDGNLWTSQQGKSRLARYGMNLSTSFLDTTTGPNSTYHYRVRAGYGSWTSPVSNLVSSLSLAPTGGTDATGGTPITFGSSELGTVGQPDNNDYTTSGAWSATNVFGIKSINDMTMIGSNGWVVGDQGSIFATSNGGIGWSPQTSGTTKNLRSVRFTDASNGWAVGDQGAVLRTTNGGSTWTVQTPPTTKNLNGVFALDATHVWVVGQTAGLGLAAYIGFFNGTTWTQQTTTATQDLNFVDGADASHVWAVGQSGTLLFFNGTSWSAQTSGTTQALNAVTVLDSTHAWAVGNNGVILATTNGTAWSTQTSGTTAGLNDVSFADATHGWAVGKTAGPGQPATVLYWDGASWTAQDNDVTSELKAVHATSTTGALAAGMSGSFLTTGDGGTTWVNSGDVNAFASRNIRDIDWVSATKAYAVSDKGGIYVSSDGGISWTQQTSPTTNNLKSVDFSSATTGWAVGDKGTILRTTDGSTWTAVTSSATKNLDGVAALDATHVWVVGDVTGQGQPAYIGFYDGTSFVQQTSNTTKNLNAVVAADATHVYAVGQAGTVNTFNGSTWSTQLVGSQELRGVDALDATHVWAVGNGGTILTTSNGASWSASTSGTAQLNAVDVVDSTHVWAVGNTTGPGGPATVLFYDGSTWSAQTTGSTSNLNSVSAASTTRVLTGGNSGMLLLTQDGGTTWVNTGGKQRVDWQLPGTIAPGTAITSVKATLVWSISAVPAASTRYWLRVSTDNGSTWKILPMTAPTDTSTRTDTIDLGSIVTSAAQVSALRVGVYVESPSIAFSSSYDMVHVDVN